MTKLSDIVMRMMDAGCDKQLIRDMLDYVDERIASAAAPVVIEAVRTKRQDRNARYYEAHKDRLKASEKRLNKTSEQDATPSPPDGPLPSPAPQPSPLNPPTPSSPRPERGCALPADWQPTAKHFDLGLQLGRDRRFVEQQAEAMREWAGANRNRAVARKADWNLTFTGWLKREAAKGQRAPPTGRRTFGDIVDEGLAEIAGQANGHGHRETQHHDGPAFDLVAGGHDPDQFNLQPPDAGRWR